jgi:hypothetical protein
VNDGSNGDVHVVPHALATSLAQLGETFGQDELAYLALTSKPELPIRDRLAWHMQSSLGDSFIVSREWRRADLAVLNHDVPVLQVEAKAMYAFDVLSNVSRLKYVSKLVADGSKMAALAPQSAAYLLALITHVHGHVPAHLRKHVVKYSGGIMAALASQGGDGGQVAVKARVLWESELHSFGAAWKRFTLEGGQQWGLHVQVDAYLVGPRPAI